MDRTSDDTGSTSSKEPVTEMAENDRDDDDDDDGRGEGEDGQEDDSDNDDNDNNDDKDDYYYYDSGGQDNDMTSVRSKRQPFSETKLDGKNSLNTTIVVMENEEQAADELPLDLDAIDDRRS